MTTKPLTFARSVNCPGGLPAERAAACRFMQNPDVAAFVARLRGEGYEVVIAPDGWRPPPPPECPSGYLLTLLCPLAGDWRRVVRLREAGRVGYVPTCGCRAHGGRPVPGADRWVPGPFLAMTEQHCHQCRAGIPPGAVGYKSADGWVYCAEHLHDTGGS